LSLHINQLVESCSTCSQHRAEHREPLLTTSVPERPWQREGTDLFFWEKKTNLLVVDYFSRYIEVAHLNVATANTVIAALKDVFSRHGIPETVPITDHSIAVHSLRTLPVNMGSHTLPAARDILKQTERLSAQWLL